MLTIEKGGDDTVVISGRLDSTQAPTAQTYLDGVSGLVTLDCSQLNYISSAGLEVLMKTQRRLLKDGGKLRLIGVRSHLWDVFQLSGMAELFEIDRANE